MHLNHLNIPVADVEQTKLFFEKYFGFNCIEVKGDHALAVLTDTSGFSLVLMSQAFNRNEVSAFPSAFHIGFLVQSKEEVTDQYAKLKDGGLDLANEPANMRGVFGFYFTAPGKYLNRSQQQK